MLTRGRRRTHVREEVKKRVAHERADSERHEQLEKMVEEDPLHDDDEGDGGEPDEAEEEDAREGAHPHCNGGGVNRGAGRGE